MATNDLYTEAARSIQQSACTIAVTGSGISAESGIPTFRDKGGIWEKYPPDQYATIDGYNANPKKVWAFWRELASTLGHCKPNPGHYALAELEAMGKLEAIVTQNIDNLHQDAGSRRVIEYHGNGHYLFCPDCQHREPLDAEKFSDGPPQCPCGAMLRPEVVMFGDPIPPDAMTQSAQLAQRCQVMIVVGTSAQVYPAAYLPTMAKQHGAFIIEANTDETSFTHTVTDVFLKGRAGETLPKLVETLKSI